MIQRAGLAFSQRVLLGFGWCSCVSCVVALFGVWGQRFSGLGLLDEGGFLVLGLQVLRLKLRA